MKATWINTSNNSISWDHEFDPWVPIWDAYNSDMRCALLEAHHHGIEIEIPEHHYTEAGKLSISRYELKRLLELAQMKYKLGMLPNK